MIRLLELGLLLSPLAAYLLWRTLTRHGIPNPSRTTLLILAAGIAMLGGSLVLLSIGERHAGTTRYVPAHLENGRLIPGRAA